MASGNDSSTSRPIAVIVGAGPAGVALAACLARRGWRCEVFERRATLNTDAGIRGYPMSLTARSYRTLRLTGLDLKSVGPQATPRTQFFLNGKLFNTLPAHPDPEKCQYLVDRTAFNYEMVTSAQSVEDWGPEGGSIQWHFGHQLESVDFDNKVASFESSQAGSSASPVSFHYDLLIGADGYNSTVRREMEKHVPGFKREVLLDFTTTYKTFHGLQITPAVETVYHEMSKHVPGQALYWFRLPNAPMLAMWKQADGTVSGLLTSTVSWQTDKLREVLLKFFSDHSEGLREWIQPILDQVSEEGPQAPSSLSKVQKVSQFHGPSCVLVGDAAHSVSAGLGQGCNSALESVRVFLDTLDSVGVDKAPEEFTRRRIKDAHALQDMEMMAQYMNPSANKLILQGKERRPNFLEKMHAMTLMFLPTVPGMLGHKLAPKLVKRSMPVFALFANPDLRYSEIHRGLKRSGYTVLLTTTTVLAGAAALTVGVVRKALAR